MISSSGQMRSRTSRRLSPTAAGRGSETQFEPRRHLGIPLVPRAKAVTLESGRRTDRRRSGSNHHTRRGGQTLPLLNAIDLEMVKQNQRYINTTDMGCREKASDYQTGAGRLHHEQIHHQQFWCRNPTSGIPPRTSCSRHLPPTSRHHQPSPHASRIWRRKNETIP